jgi:phosphoglycolate phosphatase-like HAD superfamily hydrolase
VAGFAVFDIDGVLADVRHRLHHLDHWPKRWEAFFLQAVHDDVLEEGRAMAHQSVAEGLTVVYSTGRPERYRTDTENWLIRHRLPHGRLHMRRNHDRRPARVTKVHVARRLQAKRAVEYLVDDDPMVVEALRAAGFTVIHATWMTDVPEAGEQRTGAGATGAGEKLSGGGPADAGEHRTGEGPIDSRVLHEAQEEGHL